MGRKTGGIEKIWPPKGGALRGRRKVPSVGYLERLFNDDDDEDMEEVMEVKRPRFNSTSTPLTSFEKGSGRKQRLRLEKAMKILPGQIEVYNWDVVEEMERDATGATAETRNTTEKINKEKPTTKVITTQKATTQGEIEPTVNGAESSKKSDLVANKKKRGRKPSVKIDKGRKVPNEQSSTKGISGRKAPKEQPIENKKADEENLAKKGTKKETKKGTKKVTFDSLAQSGRNRQQRAKTSDLKKNEPSKEASSGKHPIPTKSRHTNAPPEAPARKRRLRSNKTTTSTVVRRIQKSKKQKPAVKSAKLKTKPSPQVNPVPPGTEPVHHLSKNRALKQSICHSSFLRSRSMSYTELLAACRKSFDPMDLLLLSTSAISC